MQYESLFFNENFEKKTLRARKITSIGIFLLTFATVAALNGALHNENYSKNFLSSILNGLSKMSWQTYLITFALALALAFLIVKLLNAKYNSRLIIVGFDFDDIKKQLKFRIRNLDGSVETESVAPYAKIKMNKKKLSDGISRPMYNCISFSLDNNLIGHYYKDHRMWKNVNVINLENSITKI